MATTADSASGGLSIDGLNGHHQLGRKNLTSPWAHVVRGESEAVPASASSPPSPQPVSASPEQTTQSDFSSAKSSCNNSGVEGQSDNSENIDNMDNGNAGTIRKAAWNKPSNGVLEVGPVMGAVSWPALSDSAKASPKSSSDSLKALSDGSTTVSQVPVIPSSPQKQSTNNANPNSSLNRQKSMKRGGGTASSANGSFTQPPLSSSSQPGEMPQINSGTGKHAPVIPDVSPRESQHKSNSNWQQRNSSRRGNGGHHPRGDGPFHNNNTNQWNPHRSFNGRDVHMQQQRVVQRPAFLRPPPLSSASFISPRPIGSPVGFPDMTQPVYYIPAPHPDSFRFIAPAPPPAIYVPVPDPELLDKIVKQIEYYFSVENLCKDVFLRRNMDEQGWVPISLIASFNRVKMLTEDIPLTESIPLILYAIRSSTVVEVQGDRIRKCNDWMNWLLQPAN